MKPEQIVAIVLALLVFGGAALLLGGGTPSTATFPEIERFGGYAETPYVEILNPSGFVNTDGITVGELVGKKVILIDFLTYSCINCQRTFPFLNAWYEAYKDEGLEIIGIHTPEFAFEKNIDNVRTAMRRFEITHPIVLDNDYATWRAYKNQYWPRKYLIDIHGNIVYDHIGEGAYEETEMKIRELLAERAEVLGAEGMDPKTALTSSNIVEKKHEAQSPETYFGSLRNQYLANGASGISGVRTFTLPDTLRVNGLYLGGRWNITDEYAEAVSEAMITYRFYAGDVFIVADADKETAIEVWLDGERISSGSGEDVVNGIVRVGESRLYTLVKLPEPGEHILEMRVTGGSARFYAFTFG